MDIKSLREKCGFTQAELAEKCGVTLRTIQNWENGRTVPDSAVRLLETICGKGETISSSARNNSVSVSAGSGSSVNVGTETERFINAIENQQKVICRQLDMIAKSQEQIDRLIGLLEKQVN